MDQITENQSNMQIGGGERYSKNENIFSNKIILISIFMGICIVYQHVKFDRTLHPFINEWHDFAIFIRNACVPMFFAISGYLFFRGFNFAKLKSKLRRRVDTLLIPYLIWNIVYVILFVVLYKMGYMKSIPITLDFAGILKGVVNSECSPLWFVRYLMLFVCIAPLAYFVLRYRILGALFILGLVVMNIYNYMTGAFVNGIDVNANTLVMFNYQFIFFALGAYGALCWSQLIEHPSREKSYISIIIMLILVSLYWCYLKDNGTVWTNHIYRVFLIPLFWFAFDILPEIKIMPWMKFSFFIYCSHMFVLYCAQGITARIYPYLGKYQPLFAFVEYIILGILTVYLLLKIVTILKFRTPKIFCLISGNRG